MHPNAVVISSSSLSSLSLSLSLEIDLLRGGTPQTDYMSYANPSYPTAVRIAAVECVIRQFISEDWFVGDGTAETENRVIGRGFGSALLWTLKLIQSEPDQQVQEGCMGVLLDALDGRPPSAPFRARFQSDCVLDGQCDPWCERDLWALSEEARSPSARGGIPPAPVPNFEGAEEVVEILWDIFTRVSAWNQGLRVSTLQLYESLWGFDVPACLQNGNHPDLRGKGEWDRGDLDLAVSIRVQDWIIYRPTRREAPQRDWKQWRQAVASGHSYPQPDERGWSYGPASKEGILELGKLEPLSAPKLIIRLPTSIRYVCTLAYHHHALGRDIFNSCCVWFSHFFVSFQTRCSGGAYSPKLMYL